MAPFKKRGSNSGGTSDRAASSSSAAGAASAPLPTDDFSARRSARVSVHQYAADGDTWVEALAVCEIPVRPGYGDAKTAAASKKPGSGGGGLFRRKSKHKTINDKDGDAAAHGAAGRGEEELAAASQRLTLRPYFQSQNTGQRVWDEPPSGASNIVYATPEARKMASAQLEEMRSTYAHAAVQRRQEREEKKALKALEKKGDSDGGKGTKLVPKLFRRSSNSNNSGDSSSLLAHNHSRGRIKGSLVLEDEGGRKGIPKSILEESKQLAGHKSGGKSAARRAYEADLEKAMLMSMGIGGGSVMGVGENRRHRSSSASRQNSNGSAANATSGLTREEEEQLAMAKALSLSEQEAFGRSASKGSSDGSRGSRKENFDASFDGGGKMPPPLQSKKSNDDPNADFGDRGGSWELSWSRSG